MDLQQDNRIDSKPSALCSLGHRPVLMEGAILQLLRKKFAQPFSIENISLENYLWTAAIARDSLLIEPLLKFNPAVAGARPAILVRHQEWSPAVELSIGGVTHGATAVYGAAETVVGVMQGTISVFVLCREPGEVMILGAEVVRHFRAFRRRLAEQLDLLRFGLVGTSAPTPVKEAQDHFGMAIDLAYAHNDPHEIWQHTPRMDSITITDIDLPQFR